MSKATDVAFGRRGGHLVPPGFRIEDALDEIDQIRRRMLKEGTWPTHEAVLERIPLEGQARMARARLVAGVPLNEADRQAIAAFPV